MNWADLYSAPAVYATGTGQATGPTGPNQSIVTGPGQVPATMTSGVAPAFTWLGMVLALVAMALLTRMGGRVA